MDNGPTTIIERTNELEHTGLNQEKIDLFNKMEHSNENMFITGKAGSGKSYLLKYFISHTKKNVVVTAPTGIAALNVDGQTIHSFFHLGWDDYQDLEKIKRDGVYGKEKMLMRGLDVLVIDEISMVSSNMMDAIDLKMRMANENNQAFGGKQVIFFGDLYQLPPVIGDKEAERCIEDKYGSKLFFAAPAFRHTDLKFYELKTVFRQNDEEYVKILNSIRVGNIWGGELEALNSRCNTLGNLSKHEKYVTITPTRAKAAQINQENLDKIPRQEFEYHAIIDGEFGKQYPTERVLKLKVGAQVMMLVNDTADSSGHRRWANGTLAVVSELTPTSVKVYINKVEYSIDRHTWEKKVYDYDPESKKLVHRVVSKFNQYPICLAYALTIHKAQGQTYQSVAIDMHNGAFDTGQTYVALSRCVALDNLYLVTPIKSQDIRVDQEVVNYMHEHGSYDDSEPIVYKPGDKNVFDYDDEDEADTPQEDVEDDSLEEDYDTSWMNSVGSINDEYDFDSKMHALDEMRDSEGHYDEDYF